MKDSVEQELARDGSAVRIRAPRARHAIDFTRVSVFHRLTEVGWELGCM